jgi:hypothetical protein
MFYKIVHHIVTVPTPILIPTDPRIRQFHPFTYRHLHAFKDSYKYSFFPNTIIHWNLLPQTIVLCPTVNTFREQLTPTVLESGTIYVLFFFFRYTAIHPLDDH